MEKKQHSAKFLRRRKLMMVLPLLVIPFLTMAFWALGGGTSSQEVVTEKEGLNLELPDANLKENSFDKLSFYKQAETDSAKLREQLKTDPYYRNDIAALQSADAMNASPYDEGSVQSNTQRVNQKLAELNCQLNNTSQYNDRGNNSGQSSSDVDRLHEMMQAVNTPGEEDAEMNQINSVLDKIMDVQHPARVRERIKEASLKNKQVVYTVSGDKLGLGETIMKKDSVPHKRRNRFYSEASKPLAELTQNAGITAVVHESQTLVAGSTVKLRLTSDVYINGFLVPSGSFVFGTASLENERLLVTVKSINYRGNLLPVSLSVHDIDGVAGIYVPGSINRDVAKQSAEQSLSSVDLISMDPSIQAQATAAGVNAAKTLLSKKVKLVKVTVKAGYKVLLKDNNLQNY